MKGERLRVTLPAWLVAAMDRRIEAGEFLDHGDLVRHALRLLLERGAP